MLSVNKALSLLKFLAIGRSTNLISHDANIIIVRGGTRRSVSDQMTLALARHFPEQSDEIKLVRTHISVDTEIMKGGIPLQRINTGVTDIVGADNGERAGGFVLVIDGAALLEVRR